MRARMKRSALAALSCVVVTAACAPPQSAKQPRSSIRHDALSTGVVISEVYGGGAAATYTHDFVELFNRGSAPVDVSGWSVQYASTTGSSWQVTSLGNFGSLAPGQSLLIRMATTGGATALPSHDVNGGSNLSGTAGKVALVSNTTALTTDCPPSSAWVDFVGYGAGTNCSEGSTAPSGSGTTSVQRQQGGCLETDSNGSDFVFGTPSPHNASATPTPCSGVSFDAGCITYTTWPTVAAAGGYDVDTAISWAELYSEDPDTASGGMDVLVTEAWFGGGLMLPSTSTFTNASTYSDCELCAYVRRGCDSNGTCAKEYFAQAGTMSVTAASEDDTAGQLVGELSNVRFVEWDFTNDVPTGSGECVVLTQHSVNVTWPDAGAVGGGAGGGGGTGGGSNAGGGSGSDAGTTSDGGVMDGGTATGGGGGSNTTTPKGCGCTSGGELSAVFGLLVVLLRRRR